KGSQYVIVHLGVYPEAASSGRNITAAVGLLFSTQSDRLRVMGSDTIMKHRIARWMEDHRGLIVVLVVLPLSNIFSAVMQLRHWIFHRFISAPENHDERVIAIQKQ
ncbi:hypothetical protein OTU49_013359, partial [Cherax quadricarinatus]